MKTQLEIEQGYSKVAFYESMDIELKDVFMQLSETDIYDRIRVAVGVNDTETITQIIKEVILMMGSPLNGIKSNYNSERMMSIQQVVSMFAQIPELDGDIVQEVYLRAFNLMEAFDGLVYDIELREPATEEQMFLQEEEYSEPEARVYIGFNLSNDIILAQLKMTYPIPMVEEPKKWTEAHNGGYLLNTSKPTLRRGHDLQPNSALAFINRMQKNKWRIVNADATVEHRNIETEQTLKGKSYLQAKEIADNSMISASATYDEIAEYKHFYFVWKYDARGRAYSQGYDLNLQGSKTKKGMQVPIFTTPKADAILELWD